MNVCPGWLPSFKKEMLQSQPTTTRHTRLVAEWQYDFAPTFYSHDWVTTLEWGKNMAAVHTKCSVSQVACICVWLHAFIWCVCVWGEMVVKEKSSGARRFRPRTRGHWCLFLDERKNTKWMPSGHTLHLSNKPRGQLFGLFSLLLLRSIWSSTCYLLLL